MPGLPAIGGMVRAGKMLGEGADAARLLHRAEDVGIAVAKADELADAARFFDRMDDVSEFARRFSSLDDTTRFSRGNFRKTLLRLTGKSYDGTMEAHHVLPVELEESFTASGIKNIHSPKYGAWVDAGPHRGWSNAYNNEWYDFFRYGSREISDIEEFGRTLGYKYGFTVLF